MTAVAAQRLEDMSAKEIVARADRLLPTLIASRGIAHESVLSAVSRFAAAEARARAHGAGPVPLDADPDDLMALADVVSPHLLANARAERARREGGA